jgi:hypothetical protein
LRLDVDRIRPQHLLFHISIVMPWANAVRAIPSVFVNVEIIIMYKDPIVCLQEPNEIEIPRSASRKLTISKT